MKQSHIKISPNRFTKPGKGALFVIGTRFKGKMDRQMITKGVTSEIPNAPELYNLFTSGKRNRTGQCFLGIHNYSGNC